MVIAFLVAAAIIIIIIAMFYSSRPAPTEKLSNWKFTTDYCIGVGPPGTLAVINLGRQKTLDDCVAAAEEHNSSRFVWKKSGECYAMAGGISTNSVSHEPGSVTGSR